MVPVRWVDVSDAEADAMTLADNARALQGVDDPLAIVEMAQQFGRESETMRDIGFDADALDAIVKSAGDAVLADGSSGERVEVDEDEAPIDRAEELGKKWNVKLGQSWIIPSSGGGEHRILCGDSTKRDDVARVMSGQQAVWCWTDPPYGVEYVGKTKDSLVIENDGASDLPMLLRGAFQGIDAALCDGAPIYVAHPPGALSYEFATAWKAIGWKWHQTLAWVKQTFVLGHADYHYQHEPIMYGWKGKNRRWYGGRNKRSVLSHDKPIRNGEHPTMKPISLVADCLQNSSQRGDIGYEPFSGSGTTLVAAEQTGRLCRAIELSPKYVAVALERLAALGLEPRLSDA
jgi:site-specific DNA-methyltransferase (adenine-specific)